VDGQSVDEQVIDGQAVPEPDLDDLSDFDPWDRNRLREPDEFEIGLGLFLPLPLDEDNFFVPPANPQSGEFNDAGEDEEEWFLENDQGGFEDDWFD
jgi:hypothetical protein